MTTGEGDARQLNANATYYWRVDLYNTVDDTTITGEEWHFTTGWM